MRFQVHEVWSEDDEIVTYDQIKTWVFLPEKSKGSLDDLVINVNMVALVRKRRKVSNVLEKGRERKKEGREKTKRERNSWFFFGEKEKYSFL